MHSFGVFNRGFSLIEVMVTIVIIGLLSTVVLINVLPSRDKAMVEKAKTDIAVLKVDAKGLPTVTLGAITLRTPSTKSRV